MAVNAKAIMFHFKVQQTSAELTKFFEKVVMNCSPLVFVLIEPTFKVHDFNNPKSYKYSDTKAMTF